ncbi:glycosyltransferase family 4 protein [Sulfurimonas sp. NWX79]|uniref:glycosyltransferase family 4 protein n=1 Tax=Sulfurimonas sp. NWX79 TaxID=2925412 RepID=UPI00320477A1
MNIWIFNHHALTPDMSGGTRHYDFAKELVKRGHSVTIAASSFHYSKYKEMKEYKNQEYLKEDVDGIDFIWIETPPYFGNGISRVKNMLSYSFKVLKIIPKLDLKKPDIIVGSSVHLFAVYVAYRLSKRYRVPFVMEVRDLWPQTLIDMGISKWHPFILLLSFLEKFLYKKADKIITLLPKAHLYIEKLNIPKENIVWISNGSNISNRDRYKQLLDSSKFNILYTGSHGIANNLEVLIDVADILREDNKIHFTLIGEGALKEQLIKKANLLKLSNITFLDSVSKNQIIDYLKSADLLYVGLKNLPLYRYGMSMNKVFDYMSAKKPILFVSNIEDNIIEKSNSGKVIKENNIQLIAKSIKNFSIMSKDELNIYGENGYNYLKDNFSIEVLTNRLEKILKEEVLKKDDKSSI